MIHDLTNILSRFPIIPVIVLDKLKHALPLAQALVDGGVKVIEITLRTPISLTAIKLIKKHLPNCIVGAGTIVKPSQFVELNKSNVDFAVSPGISPKLIQASQEADIPYLPGVATPSDILLAIQHNFSFLKFFPASLQGGVEALRNFMSIFPTIQFLPTGGITSNNMTQYFSLKNVMCIGGSWLAPHNLIENQEWGKISELVNKALKEIKKEKIWP